MSAKRGTAKRKYRAVLGLTLVHRGKSSPNRRVVSRRNRKGKGGKR